MSLLIGASESSIINQLEDREKQEEVFWLMRVNKESFHSIIESYNFCSRVDQGIWLGFDFGPAIKVAKMKHGKKKLKRIVEDMKMSVEAISEMIND